MRIAVAIVGGIVSLGLLVVSAFMNFRFGQLLGKDEFDQLIYGIASVCGDGFKAVLPFAIAWAWSERRMAAALAGVVLFSIATAYSVTSSLGFAATNRAATSGERAAQVETVSDLQAEIRRTESEFEALAEVRPVDQIVADMAAARAHRRWTSTSGCTDATVPQSIAFCAEVAALSVERRSAERRAELSGQISELRAELREARALAVESGAAGGAIDPQVSVIRQVFQSSAEDTALGLTLLIAAFVEFGSGLGFYLSFGHLKPRERRKPKGPEFSDPALGWGHDRLVFEEGSATPAADLHADYEAWCRSRGIASAMSQAAFGRWMSAQGFSKIKRGGRMYYKGVRFAEDVRSAS